MKNLIYQYYYDFDDPSSISTNFKYYELSRQSVESYCNKINVDYVFLNSKLDIPFYGIFLPFENDWWNDYDNICFIDSDFLITSHANNIFEHVSNDNITINFMSTQVGRRLKDFLPNIRENGHANTGVVNFPKNIYKEFSDYVKNNLEKYHINKDRDSVTKQLGDFDQAFINIFLGKTGKYNKLNDDFNWHLGRQNHNDRWNKNFIHYHRKNKPMMEKDFLDDRILK